MRARSLLALGIAGLCAGWITGGWIRSQEAASGEAYPGTRHARDSAPRNTPRESRAKHDLATLRKLYRNQLAPGQLGRAEMERLSAGELRDLLVTLGSKAIVEGDLMARRELIHAAGAELFLREGEAAIEWAAGLDKEIRKFIWEGTILEGCRTSPAIAKRWVEAYRQNYGNKRYIDPFSTEMLTAAAGRSAEDYIEVLKLCEGESYFTASAEDFVDGFDFEKLLASHPHSVRAESVFPYLAAVDRKAAWEIIRKRYSQKGGAHQYLGFAMSGVIAMDGEAKGIDWALTKIEELSATHRNPTIAALDDYNRLSKEGLTHLMTALASQEERAAFAGNLISPGDSEEMALLALNYLPESHRAELLIQRAASNSRSMMDPESESAIRTEAYFTRMADKLGLSPEERGRMNQRLLKDRQPLPTSPE